jgi:hypothetical protein
MTITSFDYQRDFLMLQPVREIVEQPSCELLLQSLLSTPSSAKAKDPRKSKILRSRHYELTRLTDQLVLATGL